MEGSRGRRIASTLALVACVAVAACRPTPRRAATTSVERQRLAHGAALYATYCGGCHGVDGRGGGSVARALHMQASDLRAPGLLDGASDQEVVARVLHGNPLPTAPHGSAYATELDVAALDEFVQTLGTRLWERIRAGRLVYENACAACHGAYGTGEGVLGGFLTRPPASLQPAVARYTDSALAGVVRNGLGAMPAMGDLLTPAELQQLLAYLRVLSPGYRLYDTYCASCHGDDGRGVHAEDALPPAVAGAPLEPARLARLRPEARRRKVLHMFERERGVMPHFRQTLEDAQLADIVAYLRADIR